MASGTNTTAAGQPARTGVLRIIDQISTLCGWFSAALIVISVLITCQMIFVRYFLNASTVWHTEAVTYMMVTATLIGLPYVQKLRGHVNVDLLPLMMGKTARKALAITTLLLSIAIIAVMTFYGFEFWHTAWERNWKSDTVWAVRLWIPYLCVPVGFGLFLLQLAGDLYAVLTGQDKPFNIDDGAK
jgi:TRAP-type C4-dicarboxylate transport system permease small subunit